MGNSHWIWGIVGLTWMCATVGATPEMDARFGFKRTVIGVLNRDGETSQRPRVLAAMKNYLQERPRFQVDEAATEATLQVPIPDTLGDLPRADIASLEPFLLPAKKEGLDSVILAQVFKEAEQVKVAVVALVMGPHEVVYRGDVNVSDPLSPASYEQATEQALDGLVQGLPFDAAIIKREGYRVVLDRGSPAFKTGMRLPVFTLEKTENGPTLSETGIVRLERVEPNLSFGTILVENKPLEVVQGNKVRFQSLAPLVASDENPGDPDHRPTGVSRSVASAVGGSVATVSTRLDQWGSLGVDLAAAAIRWGRTSSSGQTLSSGAIYPGAAIDARVKLTKDTFLEGTAMFGSAALGDAGRPSQSNQLRVLGGYRLAWSDSVLAPMVQLRVGYSRTRFQVSEDTTQLGPTSASFSGVLLGGGVQFPLSDSFGLGLDMNALAVASVSEDLGTSGAVARDVGAWDFSARGYYRFSERAFLQLKFLFQTHTASFTGVGTRPISLSSLSQNTQAVLTGVTYFF